VERSFENGLTIGPTYLEFGRSIPASSPRTRTSGRESTEAIHRRPNPSTRLVAGSWANVCPTEWTNAIVGIPWREDSRTEAISPSEIRNRNRSQSVSFRRNRPAIRRYFAYSRYHRPMERISPRSWNHSGVGGRGIASNPLATARSRAGEPARKNRYRSGWRETSSFVTATERAEWPSPREFTAT